MSCHASGSAKLICFKDHASGLLKLTQTDSTEDSIENVARAIHAKCQGLKIDAENYDTHASLDKSMDFNSTTLIRVPESISDRFTNSLFSALIGNIITSAEDNPSPTGTWYFVSSFKNDNKLPV